MPMTIDDLCDVAERALAKKQFDEADALYHAIAMLDEERHEGWLGIAECASARGRVGEAVRILVTAAERLQHQPSPDAGYILLGRALELDPTRLDLHLTIAQLQAKDGDVHGARSRLQQLASAYIHKGAWLDAQDVLSFAAEWDPQPLVAGEIELVIDVDSDSIPIALEDLELPKRPKREQTMVTDTVLIFPDGSPLPRKKQPWAIAAAHKSPTSRPRKRTATGPARTLDPAEQALARARARMRRQRAEATTARNEAVPTRVTKLPRPKTG